MLLTRLIGWAVMNPLVAAAFVALFVLAGTTAWQTNAVERVKTKLAVAEGKVEALRTTAQLRAIEVERLIDNIHHQNAELTRLEMLGQARIERAAAALTRAGEAEAALAESNARIAAAELESCTDAVQLAREEIGI
jgi:hypothetical protein